MPPAKSKNTKITETFPKIKQIYENEGIVGLIRQNLNKNHKSRGEYIQKYFMKGGSRTKNVNGCTGTGKPCLWCCEQLDIMDERDLWVKINFANECNKKELIEYHIQPIVDENGVHGHSWMQQNHTAITNRLKKLGKTWKQDIQIGHYNIQPKDKTVVKDGDKIITHCDSEAEAYFDLVVLQIQGLEIIYQNIPYSDDFMKKYNRTKSTYDRQISFEGKEYTVEIWGIHDDSDIHVHKMKKADYMKARKEKECYWKQTDANFIGIEYRQCNKDSTILQILRDRISPSLQFEKNPTIRIGWINEETIKQNTLDEAKLLQVDGHLPAIDKLQCSMWHRIQKFWPKPHMENFRKALGEDIESYNKRHCKKLSESRKKSGIAAGNKNPNHKYDPNIAFKAYNNMIKEGYSSTHSSWKIYREIHKLQVLKTPFRTGKKIDTPNSNSVIYGRSFSEFAENAQAHA